MVLRARVIRVILPFRLLPLSPFIPTEMPLLPPSSLPLSPSSVAACLRSSFLGLALLYPALGLLKLHPTYPSSSFLGALLSPISLAHFLPLSLSPSIVFHCEPVTSSHSSLIFAAVLSILPLVCLCCFAIVSSPPFLPPGSLSFPLPPSSTSFVYEFCEVH